jgi:hypothetical protein
MLVKLLRTTKAGYPIGAVVRLGIEVRGPAAIAPNCSFLLDLIYLALANTGLSMLPPIWNGNDSFPSFSVPPASRANRFVTNPC